MLPGIWAFSITLRSVATKWSMGQNNDTVKKLFLALSFCLAFVVPTAFAEGGGFRLISSEWHDGGSVPKENVFNGSGCGGANESPEFHWSDAPGGTKSFAITIFDLDAPTGGGWWHWVIFNIPGTISELPAGAGNKESKRLPPASVKCRNDYGEPGYGGPALHLHQLIDIGRRCMHSTLRSCLLARRLRLAKWQSRSRHTRLASPS